MYLLDANVFITSKNLAYGFDIAPGFWDWLDAAYAGSLAASVRAVGDELTAGNDDLATWVAARPQMFLQPDTLSARSVGLLVAWASARGFAPDALRVFLASADLPLVAHAHAHGMKVITLERHDTAAKKQVFVPVACDALQVPWGTPYSMLRDERVRLVLERSAA
jgi:hypothetical protein